MTILKRIWALFVCAALLVGALPFGVFAATEDDDKALIESTVRSYQLSLESTGKEALNGFCGMMTSHQLFHMGINKYLLTYDGNQQYDAYKTLFKTTGGHYIRALDAADYTLEEALNELSRNGTRDVYNILVGFQWTNTEAGDVFGHSCVINGIQGGKVYFMEGFYMPFGGEAGNVSVCTIAEFAEYYSDWTIFEGVIYFGTGEYAQACRSYCTDLIVRTRFEMVLRSQPCVIGQSECQILRSVSAGERLHVTAVVENTEGELFYRVQDGERVGYIVAQTAVPEQVNTQDIQAQQIRFPSRISAGQDSSFSGTVSASNGLIGAVELVINDQKGNEILRQRQITDAYCCNLSQLDELVDLSGLKQGVYTVTLTGETATALVRDGQLDYACEPAILYSDMLYVGNAKAVIRKQEAQLHPVATDGWYWKDGTWYCYEQGKPLSGWVRQWGVNYYLKADGSVTTGWVRFNGQTYYFHENGAMNVGWLCTDAGMRYSTESGIFVTGWMQIDGSRYYFNENGILLTEGTATDGNVTYTLQSDGRAVAEVTP